MANISTTLDLQVHPIRIGYSLSLTGPVAENTRSAQLAHQIWLEQINSRGGLLGRPVELICIDDHGEPEKVNEIYTRFLEEDHIDLLLGGYGTNTLSASLPVVMKHERLLIGLMGLGVNSETKYRNYYAMIPTGPDPNAALTEGFFELGAAQHPRPKTVAVLSADAPFSRNPVIGAKKNAEKFGFEIIHEQTYPLSTPDFTDIVAGIARFDADILFLCSYLQDSVELVRCLNESDYKPKLVGGAMIGPQSAAVKTQLGPLLNGFVNYEYWMPVKKLDFPGVNDLITLYQSRAREAGVDELGYYVVPLAYAQLQVLEQAINATKSLDDQVLSEYCSKNPFETVMGKICFGKDGEWDEPRVLQVQFQGLKDSKLVSFQGSRSIAVLTPEEYTSGEIIYPYYGSQPDTGS